MTPNAAFSNNWPYFVNSDICEGHILLFSAYSKNELIRIEVPRDIDRVCRTWITETKDLFLMGETQTGYKLFVIDLDNFAWR